MLDCHQRENYRSMVVFVAGQLVFAVNHATLGRQHPAKTNNKNRPVYWSYLEIRPRILFVGKQSIAAQKNKKTRKWKK